MELNLKVFNAGIGAFGMRGNGEEHAQNRTKNENPTYPHDRPTLRHELTLNCKFF
jgi:hypothetical protein